ncbi:MAG: sigma-54-dependent Fis family transcriptional regulator [Verrucomicrobiae bacterium]|nr:sigma-54-dependent Fis family transcriptional regulator [Verrucomicrobiae bacterium]
MRRPNGKLLVIEEGGQLGREIARVLAEQGIHTEHVADASEGLERLFIDSSIHVVLTDFELSNESGLDLLERIRGERSNVPVIFMANEGTASLAIEATRRGAFDYLLKPFGMDALIPVVRQALRTARLNRRTVHLGGFDESLKAEFMIGRVPEMRRIFKEVGRLADRNVTVLISGETGTGKELVARALCQFSNRADKPFIAVNCATIPASLLESELFGHEKGAFTGASARRIGRFEQADGGTLFLDEIGEMPVETQAKLLRVLQEKTIHRLGGNAEITVDARVVAATNRDLYHHSAQGKFREDLLYRLEGATIRLPPLRDRRGDIPKLVEFFLHHYASEFKIDNPRLEKGVVAMLESCPWPGNVRQLQNVLRASMIAAGGFVIEKSLVRSILEREAGRGAASNTTTASPTTSIQPLVTASLKPWADAKLDGQLSSQTVTADGILSSALEEAERYFLTEALRRCRNNRTAAAKLLGVSRATLLRRLASYGLE